ncbi:MAG: putative Na+/H+ antiporter [Spirochaetia bacterium]|nr:putative Na+/H+ antiporter [Spirochaetia bacterium]
MLKTKLLTGIFLLFMITPLVFANEEASINQNSNANEFPKSFHSYDDSEITKVSDVLRNRIIKEPFNLVATIIFILAILHTFFSTKFTAIAHKLEKKHNEMMAQRDPAKKKKYTGQVFDEVDFKAHVAHFLGEVEVIFGLWVIVLAAATAYFFNWHTFEAYISHKVNFTEPVFVVIIMALASSRPVIRLSESSLEILAGWFGKTPAAWWFIILTLGPILGSFITEPGAMTISAMLLARQFYDLKPSPKFAYATIGLLFVNISVGGTLSHFAAPPVLMVAGKWGWGMTYMFTQIGWKAILGIVVSNILYMLIFSKEFSKLEKTAKSPDHIDPWDERKDPIPAWIISFHVFFMAWTVFNAHNPPLFIGGFLFYLGLYQATLHHQNRNNMRSPLMVGFFLAGLVIHGGLQGWWLAPILGSLTEIPLMIGATFLTSINDNAAITYLSSLVPNLTDGMKYAVVTGAVTGGGLTVIANAPNPAGQSILSPFFKNGVSPLGLAAAAIIPTFIVGLAFIFL